MKLRFAEDRRTLIWAFGFFPLLPTLVYVTPSIAPWCVLPALYLAYSAGILVHNHLHCPVFASRRHNLLYGAWLSFFYGCPLFTWIPTHLANHHRFVNGEGDVTRTTRHASRNGMYAALTYPFASSRWQAPLVLSYVKQARLRGGRAFAQVVLEVGAIVLGHGAALAFAVALYGVQLGVTVYAFAFGIPAVFAPWSMMFTNFVQHVGCDPSSSDDHSRNFVNPWVNWLLFEAGHHTVHHEAPQSHWSTLPARHRARRDSVDPALNRGTILGYCAGAWLGVGESGARRVARLPLGRE